MHKIIKERTLFQMVNFHKQRAITTESMVRYAPLSSLKKDTVVLNNVTKFHKILNKSIQLKERTSFQMVNFINIGP